MKSLFAKRGIEDGLVSLAFSPEGVGLARVSRRSGMPPVLADCDFEAGAGDRALVGRLAGRHKVTRVACSVLIGVDDYSLLQVNAPEVPVEEMRAAVRWQVRDLIDFDIDDAVIDVFDLPPHKVAGRPRTVYVVAARTTAVCAHVESARAAGLQLGVIDIPELAQRNIAAELPEDAAGVAVLAVDAESGLITLTRQGTLYLARRLELGLDALGDEAENLEGEPQGRTRDWLDALLVQVQRSLDYYENNFAQPPIADLVLAPLARPVPGMAAYLATQLGLRVRELDLNELIDMPEPLDAAAQARCFAAVGAALRTEERPQ